MQTKRGYLKRISLKEAITRRGAANKSAFESPVYAINTRFLIKLFYIVSITLVNLEIRLEGHVRVIEKNKNTKINFKYYKLFFKIIVSTGLLPVYDRRERVPAGDRYPFIRCVRKVRHRLIPSVESAFTRHHRDA